MLRSSPIRSATPEPIGEALRKLNFEVDEVYDPDFRQLTRALREFGIKAQQSDVAVIYYAGHGVQVARENYLLPADARTRARARPGLRGAVARPLSRRGLAGPEARHHPAGRLPQQSVRRPAVALGDHQQPGSCLRGSGAGGQRPAQHAGGDGDQGGSDRRGRQRQPQPVRRRRCSRTCKSRAWNSACSSAACATACCGRPTTSRSRTSSARWARSRSISIPRPPNRPPVIGAIPPLEVRDNAGPTPLPIPTPTDPDQDPLTVRVTGLPRAGEVRIEGRLVTPGAVYNVDRFATATYKPTGSMLGRCRDGRHPGGGRPRRQRPWGACPSAVVASNRPPVTEARRRLRIYTGALGIAPPTDPDGDKLTVTVAGAASWAGPLWRDHDAHRRSAAARAVAGPGLCAGARLQRTRGHLPVSGR